MTEQENASMAQECMGCGDARSEYKIAPLDPGEIRGQECRCCS